jgi:hypothetical protein
MAWQTLIEKLVKFSLLCFEHVLRLIRIFPAAGRAEPPGVRRAVRSLSDRQIATA